MKPIPLKKIQYLISRSLPTNMDYAKKRVKIGKGKKKHTQLKVAGTSEDRMFFIMCYNSPVTRMEFMVPFIPLHLSRTTAVIKVILDHFFPDAEGYDEWLTETVTTIPDNGKVTNDYKDFKLTISRLDVYGQQIIMMDVA